MDVEADDTVTYYLTVTSTGTDTAKNVIVTDEVPDGLILKEIFNGGKLGDDKKTITWELGDLEPDKFVTVSFSVTVPKVIYETKWKNIAHATYDNPPGDPNDPSDPPSPPDIQSDEVKIGADPDPAIEIHKYHSVNDGKRTQDRLEVDDSDEVTYYLIISSTGEGTALNVVVTDMIPKGLTLVAGSISDGGTVDADNKITWNLGNMEPDTVKEVSFKVKVPEVDGYDEWTNIGYVNYDNPPEDSDNPGAPPSDIPSEEVTIWVDPDPHVSSEKTQALGDGEPVKTQLDVKRGDKITFYITVISDGEKDSVAKDVVVTDKIPEGLILVEGSISHGGTVSDGVITWNLGDIKVDETLTVSFAVTVPYVEKTTEWTNVATVCGEETNDVKIKESVGGLKVTKTVEGKDSDLTKNFNFTVTLTGATSITGTYGNMEFNDGVATFTLKHGETKTAIGLPTGYTYTVVETDDEEYTVIYEGATGTIAENETAEVTVTNTRNTGNLAVSKTVTGNIGDLTKDFTFIVTLTGATSITGTYGDMEFNDGVATFTLKHGETKTAIGLPTGYTYTVVETNNYGYAVTSTGETGIIVPGRTVEAAFVNFREAIKGNLTISKSVVDGDPEQEFDFVVYLYECNDSPLHGQYYYSGSKSGFIQSGDTISLKDGQSITIYNLPVGTIYAVTELPTPKYAPIVIGGSGTIEEDRNSHAEFVNIYDPVEVDVPTQGLTVEAFEDTGSDQASQTGFDSHNGLLSGLAIVMLIAFAVIKAREKFNSDKAEIE